MFPTAISNSTSLSEDASVSSGTKIQDLGGLNHVVSNICPQQPQKIKKKRSLPGNPDPDAEVIALSPKTLLATNRFVCEICHKGFQRDQNLQLHRRGHNLPWKLKQRNSKEVKKKAYVCPEPSCVHHNPSRALGDLTGIKKHYCRKHGEKKWKCEKCSKIYAVQSDWKAHSKTCGTREYRCDCGTLFSRKDSFITHRAFCDALAEESARISANQLVATNTTNPLAQSLFLFQTQQNFQNHQITNFNHWDSSQENPNPSNIATALHIKPEAQNFHNPTPSSPSPLLQQPHNEQPPNKSMITSTFGNLHVPSAATSAYMSATALLQKAATVGAAAITGLGPGPAAVGVGQHRSMCHVTQLGTGEFGTLSQLDPVVPDYMRGFPIRSLKSDRLTRDFLGLTGDANGGVDGGNGGAVDVSMNVKDMLTFTGGVEYHQPHSQHHHHALMKPQQRFGFLGTTTAPETWGNC
ncbi:protein indeterminate-domain 12-like [Abrus precatorius]|uniref:Protein indeterminate-domain 12-like n=1 Tax=Abrus precatorius TaxID=3816 RepID=A0A8B8L429_ABRPR|nr:protein indeterminate-domain 12-like [Abrus precatorius]